MLSPVWSTNPSWLMPFSRESCFDKAAGCCCLAGLLLGASIQSLSRSSGLMKAAQHRTHSMNQACTQDCKPDAAASSWTTPSTSLLTGRLNPHPHQGKGPPPPPPAPNVRPNPHLQPKMLSGQRKPLDSIWLVAGERHKHAFYSAESPHDICKRKQLCAILQRLYHGITEIGQNQIPQFAWVGQL